MKKILTTILLLSLVLICAIGSANSDKWKKEFESIGATVEYDEFEGVYKFTKEIGYIGYPEYSMLFVQATFDETKDKGIFEFYVNHGIISSIYQYGATYASPVEKLVLVCSSKRLLPRYSSFKSNDFVTIGLNSYRYNLYGELEEFESEPSSESVFYISLTDKSVLDFFESIIDKHEQPLKMKVTDCTSKSIEGTIVPTVKGNKNKTVLAVKSLSDMFETYLKLMGGRDYWNKYAK